MDYLFSNRFLRQAQAQPNPASLHAQQTLDDARPRAPVQLPTQLLYHEANWMTKQERLDHEEALRLQEEMDREDELMRIQLQMIEEEAMHMDYVQQLQDQEKGFECGVCFDELPMSEVAKVEGCGHQMCRECLRGYVVSKIDDRKYPIVCPLCTVGKGKTGKEKEPSVITEGTILLLGVEEAQFAIYQELELTQFAVPIQCRKCNRTSNLDRNEFQENKVLVCPWHDCSHSWCKSCQQPIDSAAGSPEHSCDGSKELDHLILQEGWKKCPECKTPIQRISGCNHMSCQAPGCNTHFCYKCGGVISRSLQGWTAADSQAKSTHLAGPCGTM